MEDMNENELSRQTEMFEELISKVIPALPTRSSALVRRYLEEDAQYDMGVQISEEEFKERGLVLVDRYDGPLTHGTWLVLLTDGTLAELRRSESRSSRGYREWTATLRHLSPRDAVIQYGFASCVQKLTAAREE